MHQNLECQRLDSYLDYHARVHEGVLFVTEEESSYTFAEALVRIEKVAGRLESEGLKKGDRIALLGKNSINFLFMYLACSKLGVVPVGINYRLTAKESSFVINDSNAKMLFADSEFIDALADSCEDITVIALYGQHGSSPSLERWLGEEKRNYDLAEVTAKDTLSQMYTSGTTGLPKGVLLSHNNVIANVYQTAMASEYTFMVGSEFLLVAPMYHAAGIMTAYTGLVQGLTLVIHRDYNPQRVIDTLVSRPIAAVTLVPAMLQFIFDNIPDITQHKFPSLQLIYYGASPMSVPLLKQAMDVFGCDFTQGYGQTEANSIVAMLSASDHRNAIKGDEALLNTCGRAAFNTELRVVDDDGVAVANGKTGEIVVRGPQVMQGYWNNSAATASTLRDGWLHTGDIGVLDDRRYLTIVGRLKDMIISGGENIYPAEIESVLQGHPAIKEVAVIGLSNAKWGEVPLAVLVSHDSELPSTSQLVSWCKESLATYKVPAHFVFIDVLPRNPSGKIMKQQLREEIGKSYE